MAAPLIKPFQAAFLKGTNVLVWTAAASSTPAETLFGLRVCACVRPCVFFQVFQYEPIKIICVEMIQLLRQSSTISLSPSNNNPCTCIMEERGRQTDQQMGDEYQFFLITRPTEKMDASIAEKRWVRRTRSTAVGSQARCSELWDYWSACLLPWKMKVGKTDTKVLEGFCTTKQDTLPRNLQPIF